MTVSEMRSKMTVREFGSWRKYSRQRGLPTERLQLQLALLAMIVVNALSDKNDSDLSSFMIGESEPVEAEAINTPMAAAQAFVGKGSKNVVRLGQKRNRHKKAK